MEISIFKDLTTSEKVSQIVEQAEQYKGLVVDMNDPKERKKVKDSASVINDMLKRLDRARIDKKKAFADDVEREAARIREALEEANKPLTQLIDAHKEQQRKIREAEQERQDKISSAFTRMNDVAMEAIGQTSTVIESIIDELADYDFDPEVFQERTDEAVSKHRELMERLEIMKKQAISQEEMEERAAEIERKEREQAKREEDERLHREREKIAQEAAERARIEAEERHKREILESEQKAKAQAEQAAREERERIEAEQQAKIEEERKREADKKHKGAIHSAIVKGLTQQGLSVDDAKSVVKSVALGKIPNLKIIY